MFLTSTDESAIDLALSNITVVEGDNVTLHCNATGIPTPNITWTKDSNLTVIHQGETYNIADIEKKGCWRLHMQSLEWSW